MYTDILLETTPNSTESSAIVTIGKQDPVMKRDWRNVTFILLQIRGTVEIIQKYLGCRTDLQ